MTEPETPENRQEHSDTTVKDQSETVGDEPAAEISKPESDPTETQKNAKEHLDAAAKSESETSGEGPVAGISKPESDPALERLRIDAERYKARLEFRKHVIVSGFVAAAIAAIPPGFQYATAKLEEAKSAAQLQADLKTKEADLNQKQEESRQEYIKLFIDMAVDQDIELRLRF